VSGSGWAVWSLLLAPDITTPAAHQSVFTGGLSPNQQRQSIESSKLQSVCKCHNWLLENVPSVLWRCWLGGRKGIRPVKNWEVRCWHGYLSGGARCRLACAQLMPLPLTVSCFSKIQIGFTFLVPAHPGSRGHRAVKRVCVCVCVWLLENADVSYLNSRLNWCMSAA